MKLKKRILTLLSCFIIVQLLNFVSLNAAVTDLKLDNIVITTKQQNKVLEKLKTHKVSSDSNSYEYIQKASKNYSTKSAYTQQENYEFAKDFIETFYNLDYESLDTEKYRDYMIKYTKDRYKLYNNDFDVKKFWEDEINTDKINKLKMEAVFLSSPELVYNYNNRLDKAAIRGILYFKVDNFIEDFELNGTKIDLKTWYQIETELTTKVDTKEKYLAYNCMQFIGEAIKVEE